MYSIKGKRLEKSTNNKKGNIHIPQALFLGTSIVPKGYAAIVRKDQMAQRQADYKTACDSVSKEAKGSIRMNPLEFRVAFIPFERTKKQVGETANQCYHRDKNNHIDQVEKALDKFHSKFIKDYPKNDKGISNENLHTWQLFDTLTNVKKTSQNYSLRTL